MVNLQDSKTYSELFLMKHKPGYRVIDQGSVYEGQITRARPGSAQLADALVLIRRDFRRKCRDNAWARLTTPG